MRGVVDLPESVEVVEDASGLSLVRVATPAVTGEVYLQGAHISAWRPAGEADVIWMSQASTFVPAAPIRGGVPICFPWFGPGLSGEMSPLHGFARLVPWSLAGAEDAAGTVDLRFLLTDADVADAPAAQGWRHPFELTYAVSFGPQLAVALTARNTGPAEFTFEEALHTYVGVTDITRTRIEGLDGAEFLDRAPGAGTERTAQAGQITFTGETDRVYFSTAAATVVDEAGGRRITVTKEGSGATVVWNPWIAKAAAMADFGDQEWRAMVCLETANAMDTAISLPPGAEHTMSAVYRVDQAS